MQSIGIMRSPLGCISHVWAACSVGGWRRARLPLQRRRHLRAGGRARHSGAQPRSVMDPHLQHCLHMATW